MGALYIIVILMLRVVQNYFTKRVSNIFPKTMQGRNRYLALSMGNSALFALIFLLFSGRILEFQWSGIVFATVSGLAMAGTLVCTGLALKTGTIVMQSVFSTAGLIVPCICGIFFFHEPMSFLQWMGVFAFIAAAYLLGTSARQEKSGFSFRTVLLLFGCFFFNGIVMLCQKALTFTDANADLFWFSFLAFAIPAVIFSLLSIPRDSEAITEKLNRKLYVPVVFLALALFLINLLATAATRYVSSVVLFAFINGGNTIIAAVIAAVCYREKPTARLLTGLGIGLAALAVINAC